MTFKQITDSFNKRFDELSTWLSEYLYKFNHLELDEESIYFDFDEAKKKECATTVCQCYRDLISLSDDIATFCKFASKDSEKETLWNLHVNVDDYCDKVSEYVYEIRYMYDWTY